MPPLVRYNRPRQTVALSLEQQNVLRPGAYDPTGGFGAVGAPTVNQQPASKPEPEPANQGLQLSVSTEKAWGIAMSLKGLSEPLDRRYERRENKAVTKKLGEKYTREAEERRKAEEVQKQAEAAHQAWLSSRPMAPSPPEAKATLPNPAPVLTSDGNADLRKSAEAAEAYKMAEMWPGEIYQFKEVYRSGAQVVGEHVCEKYLVGSTQTILERHCDHEDRPPKDLPRDVLCTSLWAPYRGLLPLNLRKMTYG